MSTTSMNPTRIVVVGGGMVGHRFVEELLARYPAPVDAGLAITVLAEEARPAYDRVHLSAFFSGKTADDLSLVTPGFYDRAGLSLRLNARVQRIDRVARQVEIAGGECLPYDRLVLATGSYPFVPPVPGRDRDACHVYRTIEDLEAMQASGARSTNGVVIGGGLLGLECAKALKDLGLNTHVIEFAPRLMAVQVDDGGGRVLRSRIEALGVTVHTGRNTLEIRDGERARHRLVFADGSHLETDMIVFSAGIRPRDELARESGLAIGPRGGIVIDDQCRSSDPDVFAIGECALWGGQIFGLVAPGYEMARVAACAVAPAEADVAAPAFAGADMSTKLKLMGVDVASIGDAHGATPGARAYVFSDERRQIYKKLMVSEDGSRVLGGVLVGDAGEYDLLLQMMLNGLPAPAAPEQLILPAGDGVKPALGIDALPDGAQICSCNNVTKGQLCSAIGDGARTVAALKSCTRAGTACGGCVPLVGQLLKAESKRLGLALDDRLCEHFAFSRQQLFHLVRAGEIRRFDALLAGHGQGQGCDICKPAVANILASCWNDHVLRREHAPLQDTNDRFLANMQKDGSYSVVPRIAGGEITPDKLIVIGQVAKRYGLYTKITGGQRIDLFGAQAHQLPLIWRELVDAGFESGHAYGKSLRTVKSCVGSTWCRYGVQDSIGMALALEHRYKGLRSPHKIKFGVSGCARECAEAQSKDIGVIATEAGWNLYVCGNGGMKPRHAELFATDLDTATLVRLIDRFLMFYVRTADRLQRTSVWREGIEGGLDYLKAVVIEDSLGLAAALEADMAAVVATYACEWKVALETPETLRQLRTFVNSDAGDDNIVFVEERGQIRPATLLEKQPRLALTETVL